MKQQLRENVNGNNYRSRLIVSHTFMYNTFFRFKSRHTFCYLHHGASLSGPGNSDQLVTSQPALTLDFGYFIDSSLPRDSPATVQHR